MHMTLAHSYHSMHYLSEYRHVMVPHMYSITAATVINQCILSIQATFRLVITKYGL